MANANIDALYVGSLKIKISHFFLRNFTFYKWCVTKVAHCMYGLSIYEIKRICHHARFFIIWHGSFQHFTNSLNKNQVLNIKLK